jgi:hypothetical protein
MKKGKEGKEEERRHPRVTKTQKKTESKTQPHND